MYMRGGNCRMARTYRDLVKIGHNIASRVDTANGRPLIFVDLKATGFASFSAELGRQVGFDVAAQRWIQHIEAACALTGHRNDLLITNFELVYRHRDRNTGFL
jgi:hypothetical protein